MDRVSYWDILEDSGLQIIRLWGPKLGKFENLNLEILYVPSPKGTKNQGPWGGGEYVYIYIYRFTYSIYGHTVHGRLFTCTNMHSQSIMYRPLLSSQEMSEFHRCFGPWKQGTSMGCYQQAKLDSAGAARALASLQLTE